MFDWPKLELTDYERKWVRPYKTRTKDAQGNPRVFPGVLRRTYERTISNDPDLLVQQTGETLQPSQQIQISRRSRVFGLTFTGGLSLTRLQITNASGTLYNVKDPRTGKFPYITSLIGGSPYMFGSRIGERVSPVDALGESSTAILSGESGVLLIDPNWVLTPNETLIFNGDWDDLANEQPIPTVTVNIAIHVWEFPGMGNADKAEREVV